ncbi:chemotaxis protein CheW [Janthinobacterium fluminis]|uniref:Chemotaxis protein CheW n=1 Tax=Janthinobacterium fluminis TaxID=2987524 RepID=A0ABT5K7P5_9BURK|nr:chemotaxis protein CheW [Janthinobacterium fluminis]MDC8760934.1 chemotaxis protein CheW [Janthinobacterium fluminis]
MTNTDIAPQVIYDCWNRIGVVGDQSCPKLARHVHCRNCEVYADAAQRNLQRPVDADYRRAWAEHFRVAADSGAQADSSALVFRVGREWLALPTQLFAAVAPHALPHALPHRSGGPLSGIVNVGGKLHPCMSLASLLGIDAADAAPVQGRHSFARLLLLQWEGQAFALPVADLHGILRYAAAAARAPAATINRGLSRFLTGVIGHADMQVGCLDAALVCHQLARALR